MPVQFTCPVCQHVLSVPDEAAGKRARCPVCNTLAAVPAPSGYYTPPPPPMGAVQNPYSSEMPYPPAEKPYSGGYVSTSASPPYWKVIIPAVGMIAGSSLSLVYWGFRVFMLASGIDELPQQPMNQAEFLGYMSGFFLAVCSTPVVSGIVIACASFMLARRGYGAAMTASIVALIPCQMCCVVTIPFGIWGLVSLMDPEVKAMFRRTSPPA